MKPAVPAPFGSERTSRTSPGTDRLLVVLTVVALLPVALWWTMRVVDAPRNGWFEGATTFSVGTDFLVFHTAGELVRAGTPELLYDVPELRRALAAKAGPSAPQNAGFAHPPAFALLMAPLSELPWQTSWMVWTVIGLTALLVAVFILEAPRPWATAGACLVTTPFYIAIVGGQTSLLWLAVLAGIAKALAVGRLRLAGAVAGLLILKPTLLLGFFAWWALDRSKRPSLWAAIASIATIIAVTLPILGRQWLEYPLAVARFAERHASLETQWAQFSPWEFFNSLMPGIPILTFLMGLAAVLAGTLYFVGFSRRHLDDWRLMFAAAVVLTLWISPHVIVYDWAMLIVPGIALIRRRPDLRRTLLLVGAWLAATSTASIVLSDAMRAGYGWGLQIAVPVFAISALWVARGLDQEGGEPPDEGAFSPR